MDKIESAFLQLKSYCEKEEFKGWDPFDGLNSKLFNLFPKLKNSRLFKLTWLQLFKRSPLNFRFFAGINKDYNPKGLGLFLSGYCNLYKIDPSSYNLQKIRFFIAQIKGCQSTGYSGILQVFHCCA